MSRIISSLLLGNFLTFVLYTLEYIYIYKVYHLTLIHKDELLLSWYIIQFAVITYVIWKYKIYDMNIKG